MNALRSFLLATLIQLGFVRRPAFVVHLVSDHPSPGAVLGGLIYIVEHEGHAKWAYLRNPADHSEVIQLSLMQNRSPGWQVSFDLLGRATARPSIRQLQGPYAHFWIRNGAIIWCEDTGLPPLARRLFDSV